ncbi:efflux RND transporter permease subunit [Bacillus sp. 2205SS5-2]|uniref:efflux RND transporter permease subunit n=1 Tax=Bacillus sp. 2205SS5-2 TaxID=3109031 RepID=UPI00300767A5
MLEWMLKRSKIFFVLFLLFVIVGAFTFTMLPQREIPETTINIGTVTTVYPGATVDNVERNITNPLEQKLLSIDGIEELNSSSAAGFSSIIVTVTEGENKKEVFSNIRQAVSEASSSFPEQAFETEVNETTVKTPIVSYHITSENREDLASLQTELSRWKEEIESLSGVAGVTIKGLSEEEIIIKFDSVKLAEKGLILSDVLSAINEEFSPTPLGKQQVDGRVVQLTVNHFETVDDMENLLLGHSPQGDAVYLRNVGQVEVTPKKTVDLITFEGKPSVSLTAFVKAGQDIPTVDERVQKKIEELSPSLPSSVELQSYYSQAKLVNDIFTGLFVSLLIAVIAVIFTTSLGLTVSGAFVVALAVPMSILIGLIPLPFSGVDLNQISVIGAIIALGILVDDSIVVNDNIQRRYKLGESALTGAINGVKEIWVSILTSSLAIVFTFLPLIFLTGGNGAFIRALPTVLITTIIASTIVALFFVPMMRFVLYKKTNKKITDSPGLLGKPLNKLADYYADTILKKSSKHPFIVSFFGLLLTLGVFALIAFTPFEFFPAADREEVTIDVTLPIGTPLQETQSVLEEMEEVLLTDEGVRETSVFAGTGLPNLFNSSLQVTGENTGQIVARVDRETQTAKGLIDQWTDPLREKFDSAQIFLNTIEQGPPSGAPVTVTIKGPELEPLLELRENLTSEIEDLGTDLVLDNVGLPEPTISYIPNREKLEEFNISIKDISDRIRLATDGLPQAPFDNGIVRRDMTIFLDSVGKDELDLEELSIASSVSKQEGPPALISLDELLLVEKTETLQRIPHIDGERAITLRAFPGDLDDFKDDVTSIVEKQREGLNNNNYQIIMGGENQAQNDFFTEITVLFIIVIFLVYLLIAFQFNSLSLPFLVLVAVYLAIAGAILGLFVTQTPISFLAVMGMVSLTGIVVRNSVVLIEFIEQAQKEGMPVVNAVIESGRARIRPILLTALTSIVALIPVAVSGDALFKPLAITIISGIMFSALLTLIIVPMLYLVFNRFRKKQKAEA